MSAIRYTVFVQQHEGIFNCWNVRNYNRSDDIIRISLTYQSSISADMEVSAFFNRDASIEFNTSTLNMSIPRTNALFFLEPRPLQMKIRLLSGYTEKRISSEERILHHSFFLFICSVVFKL